MKIKFLKLLISAIVLIESLLVLPANGSSDRRPFTFSDLLNTLAEKGQSLIDIERGQFSPTFDAIDLGNDTDYSGHLRQILASKGYDFEMRGNVMLIFDKKLREQDNSYALNRKITIRMADVSIESCIQKIAQQVDMPIYGGFSCTSTPANPPLNFNFEANDITVRDALFEIVKLANCRTWIATSTVVADKKVLLIDIQ